METIDNAQWLSWLKIKGLSDRTCKEYLWYLSKFDVDKLSQSYIIQYLAKWNSNVSRAFLNNLFLFLKSSENISRDTKIKLAEIIIPKITGRKKSRIPETITEEQVNLMAEQTNNPRDKFMILICFYGSLRLSELLSIKPYDFKWGLFQKDRTRMGMLKILGKNNKERIIFLPPDLMIRVEDFIRNHIPINPENKNLPIFRLPKRSFQRLVNDTSSRALKKRIHVHTLRHSGATWLYDKGIDIVKLQQLLGHTSINTTQIYTHVSEQSLSDALEKVYGINKEDEEDEKV